MGTVQQFRDNLDRSAQNREQNQQAEAEDLSQTPGEEWKAEVQRIPDVELDNQQLKEKQDLICWHHLLTQQDSIWKTVAIPAFENWPTHVRPFSSEAQYCLVTHTQQELQHSGFYWGPITMEEAHDILTQTPLGTFLIRDSCQTDVFFTLSYHSNDGPTSIRVLLGNLLFSLNGSHRQFVSLFALLHFYTSSSCRLTLPHRRQRPELLQQVCRRAVIRTYGAESICRLPGLNPQVRGYLQEYPHCI